MQEVRSTWYARTGVDQEESILRAATARCIQVEYVVYYMVEDTAQG
jgi:hypothetical protein